MKLAGMVSAKSTSASLPIAHPLYKEKRKPADSEKQEMERVSYRKSVEFPSLFVSSNASRYCHSSFHARKVPN